MIADREQPVPRRRVDHWVTSVSPYAHQADLALAAGKAFRVEARVTITSGGLLAISGLVSAILLSTAVLVRVAVRESRRQS